MSSRARISIRQRRTAAALAACVAAALLVAALTAGDDPATVSSAQTTPVKPGKPGDLIISGVSGTSPSTSLLARARSGRIAGVILMGRNIQTVDQVRRLTSALQRAAAAGGQPPLLIMTDQEGGTVKRFRTAAPNVSARELGRRSLAGVQAEGLRTGRDLLARGVNVNLAPVADVPQLSSNFLGTRAFSTDPAAVGRMACRFAAGTRRAGVAATLKHFPGLGGAGAVTTDDAPVRIGLSAEQLAAGWTAYRSCGRSPLTLTMVSNASYAAIGGGQPALLSPDTYATARRIGASGPFITDALEAGSVKGIANVAAKAVNAGANLVLYTGEADARAAEQQLRTGTPPATLTARAAAVRTLREALRPR